MTSFIKRLTSYINPESLAEELFPKTGQARGRRQAGDLSPHFTLYKENGEWLPSFWKNARRKISLKELGQKPLLIVFYSIEWNKSGVNFLKRINTLQAAINQSDGNVVVVSADELSDLSYLFRLNNLPFNIYQDTGNELSGKFGVFSKYQPTWNLYSGINHNIPLLSAYLINSSGQIIFNHVEDFITEFSERDLLAALRQERKLNQLEYAEPLYAVADIHKFAQ